MEKREIKFRVWDDTNQQMVTDYSAGELLSRYHKHIMQYTGLKDKNGVEIYEGDITMAGNLKCEIKFYGAQWVAEWENNRGMKMTPNITFRQHEIIGNIHQQND